MSHFTRCWPIQFLAVSGLTFLGMSWQVAISSSSWDTLSVWDSFEETETSVDNGEGNFVQVHNWLKLIDRVSCSHAPPVNEMAPERTNSPELISLLVLFVPCCRRVSLWQGHGHAERLRDVPSQPDAAADLPLRRAPAHPVHRDQGVQGGHKGAPLHSLTAHRPLQLPRNAAAHCFHCDPAAETAPPSSNS